MSKTVRSIRLGKSLHDLRQDAELSVTDVLEQLGWSRHKLDRIESGQFVIRPADLAAALDLYGVDVATRATITQLRLEAKKRGWWVHYADVFTSGYVPLEQEADKVVEVQACVVPGLLQTREYARALISASNPKAATEWIDKAVQARMARKDFLDRETNPGRLECVIDESVFLRPVGGTAAMLRQIAYLVEMGERDNITIRMLPFAAGATPGLGTSFIRLIFPPKVGLGPVVFADGLWGAAYLEALPDQERFSVAEEGILKESLSPEATRTHLASILKGKVITPQ